MDLVKTTQRRADILRKGIDSEENAVNYFKTLLKKNLRNLRKILEFVGYIPDLMRGKNSMSNDFTNSFYNEKKLEELSD